MAPPKTIIEAMLRINKRGHIVRLSNQDNQHILVSVRTSDQKRGLCRDVTAYDHPCRVVDYTLDECLAFWINDLSEKLERTAPDDPALRPQPAGQTYPYLIEAT